MTPTRIAQGLAHTAVDSVRHPLATASRVAGLVKGAASVAMKAPAIVTGTLAARTGTTPRPAAPTDDRPLAKPDPAAPVPGTQAPEARQSAEVVGTTPSQPVVPDLDPPDPADRVLVVEEALAAEHEESHFGRTTEPHAASRDEEHGESSLHPAELEELDEEAETRE